MICAGVPNDQVESFASVETQMEIEQTGKKIKEKYCMGAMEMDVSFTIDEESHVKNWDGTPLIVITLLHDDISNLFSC